MDVTFLENEFVSHRYHYNHQKNMFKNIFKIFISSLILIITLILIVFFSSVFGKTLIYDNLGEYDKFIWPIVMQDPEPFDENNLPDDKIVLNASVWKAASEKNYSENSNCYCNGKILLSLDEVKNACKNLFGNKVDLNIQNSNFYRFDYEKNIFYVDCVSYDQCYVPNTVSMEDCENLIILKVSYVVNDYERKNAGFDTPEKYMLYYLRENSDGNGFYVSKVSKI